MKKNTKVYIAFIGLTLLVGGLAALLTMGSMDDYAAVAKPDFAPPGWLFPIAWTILYTLMGWAAARVWISDSSEKNLAVSLYAIQLTVNFFWPIIFFNFGQYLFAFVWLLILIALVIATTVVFRKADKISYYFMVPYILWLVFAAVLNYSVYALNR